jgi:hypothetical protein
MAGGALGQAERGLRGLEKSVAQLEPPHEHGAPPAGACCQLPRWWGGGAEAIKRPARL